MKYNKSSCQSCIRQVIVLDTGKELTKVIVTGQHAFQWTITIKSTNNMQSLTLPNRKACLKELTHIKQQYSNHGQIRLTI